MSCPSRNGKAWSISALSVIAALAPLVSGISLQELGFEPPPRALRGRACMKAYKGSISDCSKSDFVYGCTKACKASVVEAATDLSLACEGLLLGALLEPYFSAAGEALLCSGILASSLGSLPSTAKSASAVATTSSASTAVLNSLSCTSDAASLGASSSSVSTLLPASSTVNSIPRPSTFITSTAAAPPFANNSTLAAFTSKLASTTFVATESPIYASPTALPASSLDYETLPFVIPASASDLPAALTSILLPAAASTAAASESEILSFLSSIMEPSAASTIPSIFTVSLISSSLSSNAAATTEASGANASPTPTFIFPFPAASSSTASPFPMVSNSSETVTVSTSPTLALNNTLSSGASSTHIPKAPTTAAGSRTQSSKPSETSSAGAASSSPVGGSSQASTASQRTTAPNAGIIGGVLGGSIAFAILTTTLFYYCLRRNRQIEAQKTSSWDFIDGPRRRVASDASLMSLPPMGYFEQPPVIPREARIPRSSGDGRFARPAQATSSQFSSLMGNYQHSDTARESDMVYGSNPPAVSVLRNPSPILEERDSIAIFNQGRGRAFG